MLALIRISISVRLTIIIRALCEGIPNSLLDSILFYKGELWGNALYFMFAINILAMKFKKKSPKSLF